MNLPKGPIPIGFEFKAKPSNKKYLAKEGREEFTFYAKDLEDAEEQADIWNAVVIREIKTRRK